MQTAKQPRGLVFEKLEKLVYKMSNTSTGVTMRNHRGMFSTSVIINAFSGRDIVKWLQGEYDITELFEAQHLVLMLCQYGFIYPVSDRQLVYKPDVLYRFQKMDYWPCHIREASSLNYAEYLLKKVARSRSSLEFYESAALTTLKATIPADALTDLEQRAAEDVKKSRDVTKETRDIQICQERAFWRVHRPPPDAVSVFDQDIMRNRLSYKEIQRDTSKVILLQKQKDILEAGMASSHFSGCRPIDWFVKYHEMSAPYDPQFSSQPNPWYMGTLESPAHPANNNSLTSSRVHRWSFSIRDLLCDPEGRQYFKTSLNQEYSGENLLFWERCQRLKESPQSQVAEIVEGIMSEHLGDSCRSAINIDAKMMKNILAQATEKPHRYIFEEAQRHILGLMKESYGRFLKSDIYSRALAQGDEETRHTLFRGVHRKKAPIRFERKGSCVSLEDDLSPSGGRSPAVLCDSASLTNKRGVNNNGDSSTPGFPIRKAESMSSVIASLDDTETTADGRASCGDYTRPLSPTKLNSVSPVVSPVKSGMSTKIF